MCSKKFLTVLLVSLLAVCSLSAFPMFGREKKAEPQEEVIVVEEALEIPEEYLEQEAPQVEEEQEEVTLEASQEEDSETPSEDGQESVLNELSTLSMTYSKESRLNKEELRQLREILALIYDDVNLIIEDAKETEASLLEMQEVNGKQADDLAYLRGSYDELQASYDKERSTKAYARAGGAIGFEGGLPTWGVNAAIGARFGKGLLCEMGVGYQVGTFTRIFEPKLDNLSVTASIGWEW